MDELDVVFEQYSHNRCDLIFYFCLRNLLYFFWILSGSLFELNRFWITNFVSLMFWDLNTNSILGYEMDSRTLTFPHSWIRIYKCLRDFSYMARIVYLGHLDQLRSRTSWDYRFTKYQYWPLGSCGPNSWNVESRVLLVLNSKHRWKAFVPAAEEGTVNPRREDTACAGWPLRNTEFLRNHRSKKRSER